MTLSEQQRMFTQNVGILIDWAYDQSYELTFGETYRTPEQAALNAQHGSGIVNSLHTQRLAIDLMLWIGGQYTDLLDNYRALGQYWKSLHSLNRWGGDFSKPDADHFSMEWQGVK